jgi:hypothetical protein
LLKKERRDSILNSIRAREFLTFHIFYLHNLHRVLLSAQVKEDKLIKLEAKVREMPIVIGAPEA